MHTCDEDSARRSALHLASWIWTALLLGACSRGAPRADIESPWPTHSALENRASEPASASFRATWFDGNAELSGYRIQIPRYGQKRVGELVLIYVTEPVNRRTRIKDDDADDEHRVDVMKLNANLSFLTGIYPYSVMTSVFSPIDTPDESPGGRFGPIKLTLTVQEWCGHVYHALFPGDEAFVSELSSYFADEGDASRRVQTAPGVLYEDALLIQLREFDGPFAGGENWAGTIVPSLWRLRRSHQQPLPQPATITRSHAERDGQNVTRFLLAVGEYRRSIDVEMAPPRRILGWSASDGEEARMLQSARLPYWKLSGLGHEVYRGRLGLAPWPGEASPPPTKHP